MDSTGKDDGSGLDFDFIMFSLDASSVFSNDRTN